MLQPTIARRGRDADVRQQWEVSRGSFSLDLTGGRGYQEGHNVSDPLLRTWASQRRRAVLVGCNIRTHL
ncbi:MAG: hypothetical protein AABN33_24470 [Acidobacteriota bacterium]